MKSGLFFLAPLLAVASNVADLTAKNFDDVVLKSGKPAMIEFFAVRPQNPSCLLLLMLIFVALVRTYVTSSPVVVCHPQC